MEKLKKLLKNEIQISIVLLVLLSFSSTITIGNTQITNLEIEVSTTLLFAESNNNITLTVYNDFEPIYELCVSYSFSSSDQDTSPNIIGADSCKFDKITEGDSVEFPIIIFVPEEAAGNSYTLDIVLTYKRLGYISSITEGYAIGFNVQEKEEWIELVFYELVEPDPARPGASIFFSANILNKGNIPAMYANISLLENDMLINQLESSTYLGQIDPNSPAAFDLEASVKPGSKQGSYTAEIRVSYEDEDNVPYTVTHQIRFSVIELEEERAPQGPLESILGPIRNIFFQSSSPGSNHGASPILSVIPLFILVVVIISIIVFVRRRRSKKNEFEEAIEEEEEE